MTSSKTLNTKNSVWTAPRIFSALFASLIVPWSCGGGHRIYQPGGEKIRKILQPGGHRFCCGPWQARGPWPSRTPHGRSNEKRRTGRANLARYLSPRSWTRSSRMTSRSTWAGTARRLRCYSATSEISPPSVSP